MSNNHCSCSEEAAPPRKKLRLVRSVILRTVIDLTQDDTPTDTNNHVSNYYDPELFVNPFCLPFSSLDNSDTQLLVKGTQDIFDELTKLHCFMKCHPPSTTVKEKIEEMRKEVSHLALLWNKVINRAENRVIELEAMRRHRTQ